MKIFVISDIHSDMSRAEAFSFFLEKEKPDLLLVNGDITDIGSFDQEGFARRIIEALDDSGVRVLAVPGNNDDMSVVRYLEVHGCNIHDSAKVIDGVGIIGFGGAETPFKTSFEPSNEEQAASIEKHWEEIKKAKVKIVMIHNPPYGTNVDVVAGKKHVGSKPARAIIEKLQPDLVLTAHIHEAPGEDKIGKSKIYYQGAFFKGVYGIIDIDTKVGKIKSVKTMKF